MKITLKDTEKEQLNLTKIKNYDFFGVSYEIVELEPIKQDDNYVETYNNSFFTNYDEIYFENKEIKIKDISNIEKTKEKIKNFKEINLKKALENQKKIDEQNSLDVTKDKKVILKNVRFVKSTANQEFEDLENEILEFERGQNGG